MQHKFPDELVTAIKNISVEQSKDRRLRQIINRIQVEDDHNYHIEDNVLYKLISRQWRIMIPDHLIEGLTWACHEELAHVSAYKCYLALREDFIWENMVRRIKAVLRTCHICQTA